MPFQALNITGVTRLPERHHLCLVWMGHEPSESRPKIGFIISSPHLLVSLTHLCLSFPRFGLHSGLGAQGVYFCNLPWLWGFPAEGRDVRPLPLVSPTEARSPVCG